jgi:hypothetical protein
LAETLKAIRYPQRAVRRIRIGGELKNMNTSAGTINPFQNAVGLSAVWQKCMSELYKSDLRVLVGREHGELGKLRKSLGMTQGTELIEYAIRNWGKFAQRSAKEGGKDIFPEKPSVGWLCQCHATALLMHKEELQSIAKKEAEEQAKKKEYEEAAKAFQELQKAKHPDVTVIQVTPEQLKAFVYMEEDAENMAWVDRVSEKLWGELETGQA